MTDERPENDRDDDLCVCEHFRMMHGWKRSEHVFDPGCMVCLVSPVRTPCEKFQEAK